MLVTNTTSHCFVLSSGVIIRPNVVDVAVADAAYATDSTLNQQIDALEDEDFISITGKPTDPFPSEPSGVEIPLVLTTTDPDVTPLEVRTAGTPNEAAFVVKAVGDQTSTAMSVFADQDGFGGVSVTGNMNVLSSRAGCVPVAVHACDGQSANLFEAYDEDGQLVAVIDSAGNISATRDGATAVVVTATSDKGSAALEAGAIGVNNYTADQVMLGMNAAPGQSAPIVQIRDDNGDDLFRIDADGNVSVLSQSGDFHFITVIDPANGETDVSPGQVSMLNLEPATTPLLVVAAENQSADVIQVQGGSGQTAPFLRVRDGNGNPLFRIDADGTVHIKTGGTIHADL